MAMASQKDKWAALTGFPVRQARMFRAMSADSKEVNRVRPKGEIRQSQARVLPGSLAMFFLRNCEWVMEIRRQCHRMNRLIPWIDPFPSGVTFRARNAEIREAGQKGQVFTGKIV